MRAVFIFLNVHSHYVTAYFCLRETSNDFAAIKSYTVVINLPKFASKTVTI